MMTLHQRCLEYHKDKDISIRDTLIMECLPLIEQFARNNRNLYIHYWQVEDTVSIGVMCALECIEQFDESKNVTFEAYLSSRLKFRLIDELRHYGFTPRRVSQNAKRINETIESLTQTYGRLPTDEEIASSSGLSVTQLSYHFHEVSLNYLTSFEALIENTGDTEIEDKRQLSPQQQFSRNYARQQLKLAIQSLSPKEQIVIQLYYGEQIKFKEIGFVLEVSEARVSQMHTQALHKMKIYLKEMDDE